MIGRIEGEVSAKRAGFVITSAGGVGYKIAVTREMLGKASVGKKVVLWTHLAVREASLDLFGFEHEGELLFFELLLTVPTIGPKSALTILDLAPVETLKSAIAAGNAAYLTKISGIGKKTADKIILELREKVGTISESGARALSGDEEALEALRALGYSHVEAREALRKVPPHIEGGAARLREALRIVSSP